MNNYFGFYNTSMPSSRPADYHIGCHGGSVFLDFNNYNEKLIYLTRISFDGYGCCNIGDTVKPMSEEDSIIFKKNIASKSINQEYLAEIVKKTIHNNKDLICIDALKEYGFMK